VWFLERRANNELIKKLSKDSSFPYKQRPIGKNYGNSEGIEWTMDDVKYLSRKARKLEGSNILAQNGGIDLIFM